MNLRLYRQSSVTTTKVNASEDGIKRQRQMFETIYIML